MIPGTTPTITLKIKDDTINLNEALNVYFTLSQGMNEITKAGDDLSVEGNMVYVWLEQKDTLGLRANAPAEIQLNWTYADMVGSAHMRNATITKTIVLNKQLLRRVVP